MRILHICTKKPALHSPSKEVALFLVDHELLNEFAVLQDIQVEAGGGLARPEQQQIGMEEYLSN